MSHHYSLLHAEFSSSALPQLLRLDLGSQFSSSHGNSFNGTLPASYGSTFKTLRELYLMQNAIQGSLPAGGQRSAISPSPLSVA